MLAHAVKRDVPHEHHFIVLVGEDLLQMPARVGVQAAEEFGIHPRHAGGRFAETFPLGVFANCEQDFANGPFNSGKIDRRRRTVLLLFAGLLVE